MDLVLLLSSPGCEARFFERGRAAREELRAGGAPAPPQPTLARPRKIPREIPLTFSCVGRKSGVCKTGPAWPSRALGAVGLGERNLEAWEEGTAPWVSPHGQPLPAARPAPPPRARESEPAQETGRYNARENERESRGKLGCSGGGVWVWGEAKVRSRRVRSVLRDPSARSAPLDGFFFPFCFLRTPSVVRPPCVCTHRRGRERRATGPPPPLRARAGRGWRRGARGRGDGTRGPSPVTR